MVRQEFKKLSIEKIINERDKLKIIQIINEYLNF